MRGINQLLVLLGSLICAESQDWDFVVFAQSWPATVCKVLITDAAQKCLLPHNPKAWSVHGVWPTKQGYWGPEFCNKTWTYDPEEVKSLIPELMQNWINVVEDSPLHDLWKHEWDKHGTCGSIEQVNSQIKYFSTGLTWHKQYNISSILSEANIVPTKTKTYTIFEIHNAVKSNLGVEPNVICENVDGYQFLMEIRICFSKSLELIDCEYRHKKRNYDGNIISNCNSTGILYN